MSLGRPYAVNASEVITLFTAVESWSTNQSESNVG